MWRKRTIDKWTCTCIYLTWSLREAVANKPGSHWITYNQIRVHSTGDTIHKEKRGHPHFPSGIYIYIVLVIWMSSSRTSQTKTCLWFYCFYYKYCCIQTTPLCLYMCICSVKLALKKKSTCTVSVHMNNVLLPLEKKKKTKKQRLEILNIRTIFCLIFSLCISM